MPENSFFMLKPDAIARGQEQAIFKRVKAAGLKVLEQKRINMAAEKAADLYSPHLGKSFYPGLVRFITSGPVICCRVEGENAVLKLRAIMGATDPRKADPGTIRGDLKEDNVLNTDGIIKNLVHGSDSPESASRELAIFFK